MDEDNTMAVSGVCMSIESIRFVHEIMQKQAEKVRHINENFAKYVARVQILVESGNAAGISADIFRPSPQFFHSETPCEDMSADDFSAASHYLVLQEVRVRETRSDPVPTEKWQHCLVTLLSGIDLSSYYAKSVESAAGATEGRLSRLLQRIYKSPSTFVGNPERCDCIKLMSYYLISHFSDPEREANARKELELLLAMYRSQVKEAMDTQPRVEQNLRLTITALATRLASLKSQVLRHESDVFSCILARRFIAGYVCPYEINKVTATMRTKSGTTFRRATHAAVSSRYTPLLIKAVTESRKDSKFAVVFPEPAHRGKGKLIAKKKSGYEIESESRSRLDEYVGKLANCA